MPAKARAVRFSQQERPFREHTKVLWCRGLIPTLIGVSCHILERRTAQVTEGEGILRKSAHRDGAMREMAHVSKEGFAAADAQQDAIQGHPRRLSSAEEVLEGIVWWNGSENTGHVAAYMTRRLRCSSQACQCKYSRPGALSVHTHAPHNSNHPALVSWQLRENWDIGIWADSVMSMESHRAIL